MTLTLKEQKQIKEKKGVKQMSITWVFKLKNETDTLRAYINLEKKWGMVSRNDKCYRVGVQGTEDIIDYAIEHENMKIERITIFKEYEN